jgi:hypothetical protein
MILVASERKRELCYGVEECFLVPLAALFAPAAFDPDVVVLPLCTALLLDDE